MLCLFDHFAVLFLIEQLTEFGAEFSRNVLFHFAVKNKLSHFKYLFGALRVVCFKVVREDIADKDYLLAEVIECYYLIEKHKVNIIEAFLVLCVQL